MPNASTSTGNQTASSFRKGGGTATGARKTGYTIPECYYGGYGVDDILGAGFPAVQLFNNRVLLGYNPADLKGLYKAGDLKDAGYSADELAAAGFTIDELNSSGKFSAQAIIQASGTSDKLKEMPMCSAGNYFNVARDACWQCLAGTYATGVDTLKQRIGLDDFSSGCPGKCPLGKTSKTGATSQDACTILAYQWIQPQKGFIVGWCVGALPFL